MKKPIFKNCTNHQQETLIFSQGSPFMKGNFEGGCKAASQSDAEGSVADTTQA